MKRALALFAPLLLTAPAVAEPVSQPVRLGQWTRVDGLRIRPDRVVEDSRCPENVRCVWAGRAVIRATVRDGRRPRAVDLSLGESTRIAGGELALTSVTPEKRANRQTSPRAYRFTFEYRP